MLKLLLVSLLFLYLPSSFATEMSPAQEPKQETNTELEPEVTDSVEAPWLFILGVGQDAGRPQAGCYSPHCITAWQDPSKRRYATSMAIVSPATKQDFLFEATPDLKEQLYNLYTETNALQHHLAGVFITHAHIGHYAGLMSFGREVMGESSMPVYSLPRMAKFLTENGPWSQLVSLSNIELRTLKAKVPLQLTEQIEVTPLIVPHRDEFSETTGYRIKGPNKIALFIPDIDKWQKWSLSLVEQVQAADYALIDASFYQDGELANRDMSEIPHPLVTESMEILKDLPETERNKVYFIHMNHTNPMLDEDSEASLEVIKRGFNIARRGMKLGL